MIAFVCLGCVIVDIIVSSESNLFCLNPFALAIHYSIHFFNHFTNQFVPHLNAVGHMVTCPSHVYYLPWAAMPCANAFANRAENHATSTTWRKDTYFWTAKFEHHVSMTHQRVRPGKWANKYILFLSEYIRWIFIKWPNWFLLFDVY